MQIRRNNSTISIILVTIFVMFCLGGCITAVFGTSILTAFNLLNSESYVGFDTSGQVPKVPSGDISAATHVFIHQYPFPNDGWMTGIEYLNDSEAARFEQSERIYILILRPENNQYHIINRIALMPDDQIPQWDGTTKIRFPKPVVVQAGDVFAHWQPDGQAGGPIPLNQDDNSIDGLSNGQAGFLLEDIEIGKIIIPGGFSGKRDYFIRATFKPLGGIFH